MPDHISTLHGDTQEFTSFTFSSLAPFLGSVDQPWIAVGARRDGVPIGLVLGRMVEKQRALLDSIRVASHARREGIGMAMLTAWENEARARGASSLWVRFSETFAGADALNAFLDASGWEPPKDWLRKLIGKPSVLVPMGLAVPAVQRVLANPNLTYGPLELTGEDEASLDRLLAQPAAQLFTHPFELLARYQPPAYPLLELSLAIRHRGALVGWVVAVRTAPDTAGHLGLAPESVVVEYPEMYVDQELWNTGAGIAAMIHVGRLQRKHIGEDSIAIYVSNPQTPAMVALMMRRMASSVIHLFLLQQRRKPIAGNTIETVL